MIFASADRATREQVWRLASERKLADRQAINQLWVGLLDLRRRLAENSGLGDYRSYRWQQMLRLDYRPADCLEFQEAIEQVVVPAATRVYEKYRRRIGVDRLRPWDLDLDLFPVQSPPLPPFGGLEELQAQAETILDTSETTPLIYGNTVERTTISPPNSLTNEADPGHTCEGVPLVMVFVALQTTVGFYMGNGTANMDAEIRAYGDAGLLGSVIVAPTIDNDVLTFYGVKVPVDSGPAIRRIRDRLDLPWTL